MFTAVTTLLVAGTSLVVPPPVQGHQSHHEFQTSPRPQWVVDAPPPQARERRQVAVGSVVRVRGKAPDGMSGEGLVRLVDETVLEPAGTFGVIDVAVANPLFAALLDSHEGDVVIVRTPQAEREYEVVRVYRPGEEVEPIEPAPTAAERSGRGGDPFADAAAARAAFADAPMLEEREDGTRVVKGRWVLEGKGTADDPYIVDWNMLVSAQDSYQPRRGQTELPEYLMLLHDKHVRITGFVAFPVMAQSADEMLMMLNQWDGCCIGVPPTPYDAVEVRLAQPATRQERFVTYGSVEGKLLVDPYLVRDWLVSLYLMENAKLVRDTSR